MSAYIIGGEFGISDDVFLQAKTYHSHIRYGRKHHIYVDTGRSALLLALTGIIQQDGKKEAWLPYYCCSSIIAPFKQLGFKINYYSMGDDLQNPGLLPDSLDGEVFLFINYFGKENYGITSWLDKLSPDAPGFIIEDNVQSLLSTHLGRHGDFIINSYRKFLPQPDGAVLACDIPIEYSLQPADETFISKKLIGKIIRENHGNSKFFLKLLAAAENRLDNYIRPRSMSYLSRYILNRTDLKEIAETRRLNWFYLSELLKSMQLTSKEVFPLYDSLAAEEVPLGFPVRVQPRHRDKLRDYLMQQNIFCPVHWPLPSATKIGTYENDINLSKSILTLPIDQRLVPDALSYMAEQILRFYTKM